MLAQSRLKIQGRTDIELPGSFALKNVERGHESMVGTWGLEPQTSTVSEDCSVGGVSGVSDLHEC